MPATIVGESDGNLIERLHLREGEYLRRAAVLLFHPDPTRFFAGAFVKIGYFRSETELVYQDVVEGSLFVQVDRTVELLRTKYSKAEISYEGILRRETPPAPGEALREAVLNAVAHRDYNNPAPIQIRVYDDRISLWNPGTLPFDWTLDKLLGTPHPSVPHNPGIANAFFRAGMIEAWGRGIRHIVETCQSAGTAQPRWFVEPDGLRLEFVFTESAKPSSDDEGQETGTPIPAAAQDTATQPELKPESLSARVLRQLANGPMSKADLSRNLGQKRVSGQLNKVIRSLLDHGTIEYTIPEKPQSRQQQYRLPNAGVIGEQPSVNGNQGTGTPIPTAAQDTAIQPELKPESLSARVLRQLANGPMSRIDLSRNLGQKRVSGQLNKVIRSLLDHGTIEYTIPEKSQSQQQKYRLSNAGAIGEPSFDDESQGTGAPIPTTAQDTAIQTESLSARVLQQLAKRPMSKAFLSRNLGQKRVSGQLNKVIRSLLDRGIIEYTIPEKPQSRQQKYRLSNMGTIGESSSNDEGQETDTPIPTAAQDTAIQPELKPESLSARVLRQLANGPMSKADLSRNLGQKRVSGQLNKVIRSLLDRGTIEYTIPKKPQSRQQKYRLSDAGAIGEPSSDDESQGTGTPIPVAAQDTATQTESKPESRLELQPESLSTAGLTK